MSLNLLGLNDAIDNTGFPQSSHADRGRLMDEVDDLTPTAQDYLKVIWSAVEWGEPPIEWIPGGHMTFPLSLGKVVARMKAFHDGLAAAAPPSSSPRLKV